MLRFNKLYVSEMGRLDQAVTFIVDAAISKGRLLLSETVLPLRETSHHDSDMQYFHPRNSGVNCLNASFCLLIKITM